MIYEYRCGSCNKTLQVSFPFAKNPKTILCYLCGGMAVRFFGTAPPICFKGTGWASKNELDAHDPANDNPQDFTEFTGV